MSPVLPTAHAQRMLTLPSTHRHPHKSKPHSHLKYVRDGTTPSRQGRPHDVDVAVLLASDDEGRVLRDSHPVCCRGCASMRKRKKSEEKNGAGETRGVSLRVLAIKPRGPPARFDLGG